MCKTLDQLCLLLWKNWLLIYRSPVQSILEIIVPVLLSSVLVHLRSTSEPELRNATVFPRYCPLDVLGAPDFINNGCPNVDDLGEWDIYDQIEPYVFKYYMKLAYSPRSEGLRKSMNIFNHIFEEVQELEDSRAIKDYRKNASDDIFAYIQFDDSYKGVKNLKRLNHLKITIRFPSETRYFLNEIGTAVWKTNIRYTTFNYPGPRQPDYGAGGDPGYYYEGFLALQQLLIISIIMTRKGVAVDNVKNIGSWLAKNSLPVVYSKRTPHAEWHDDAMLEMLQEAAGWMTMLSFIYPCMSTVKSIATEKEKQLKEAMKIMGLSSWLHWLAWFVRTFTFLFVSIILIVIVYKVKWNPDIEFAVFTYTNSLVFLLFLTIYVCATITFCFAVSVFFAKANTASIVAGVVWFFSFIPFIYFKKRYAMLPLSTKLLASLALNTAMGYGYYVLIMFEGTAEGVQWETLFRPNTSDDNLSLGLIMVMLAVDAIIYLIVALYFEAVVPGEFGVPRPWYFLCSASFWCGDSKHADLEGTDIGSPNPQYFEDDPQNLKAGIQIRNLKKTFGKNRAVRGVSLNMYEDQITVLLGHNGAGKSTTMSMLTGLTTPSSGTAKLNGYDIRTDMNRARSSLGLCPQHNIIFDELTVSEHIYFYSKLKGLSRKEAKAEIDKYVVLLDLEPKRHAKCSTLSGGMKRKVCAGIALCGHSKVVMLDEPSAGMDPSARRVVWDLLQSQKQGRTMLLTTHYMDEADLLGDRIAIMVAGELQCCGSSFFLKKKYGAGYNLVIEKSRNCDVGQVNQLLRKHIANISPTSNVGSELTYLLTENQSSHFAAMMQDLEANSARLGINSYGISLTTMEEVFMKVGADRTNEESPDETSEASRNVNAAVHAPSTTGCILLMNQFLAMLIKKWVYTFRWWILFLSQILLPIFFIIISSISNKGDQFVGELTPVPLSLSQFKNPVTLVENDGGSYAKAYKKLLRDLAYSTQDTKNITAELLHLTHTVPNTVRYSYIVGASFESMPVSGRTVPKITAWFNNDPFHAAGISVGLVLNTMFRQMLDCSDCLIEFINYPLPYHKLSSLLASEDLQSGLGFHLARNLGLSMAFVTSIYIIFIIKENASDFKHLQFVSGVKVLIFWLTCFLCDMVTYSVIVGAIILVLLAHQEEGYKTTDELGRFCVILFYFGWAALPMTYLAGYLFTTPSNGFVKLSLFCVFTGVGSDIVKGLFDQGKLHDLVENFEKIAIIFPHYSLMMAIMNNFRMTQLYTKCSNCIADKKCRNSPLVERLCTGIDNNYYRWKVPGIGKYLHYMLVVGAILFILLLAIEYEVCNIILYLVQQIRFSKRPPDAENEDSDVKQEKQKIRNASEQEIRDTYTLAIRDLTKYYIRYLAVNSLCLGVQNYECFGLLGINGAGKTTTFKMLTGDIRISYGDGWVTGFSIRRQMKKVRKAIGYCPQFDALLDDMTAKETIVMFALLRGIRLKNCTKVAEHLAKEFDFIQHLNKRVKALSGGNKRKLSTAIALIGDPPVVYLDEPTAGMDPATKRYLWNALCKVRNSGKCIVLTSHSMEECEALCTRMAIMVNGNFKCLGSTQHLKSKFAEGFSLTIKMKKLNNKEQEESAIRGIEDFVQKNFKNAVLREKHQQLLEYTITDTSQAWSKMFGILEQAKGSNPNIQDYSLGQGSLEQVFLTFAKKQQGNA